MRIWKRLLGTALCLCAAVCLMSVSASAAEHSNHPVCGETHKDIGDHTGPCSAVEWIEVTQKDVTDNNGLTLKAGNNYYLGENIKVKWEITIKGTVNLCLNGHSIERTYATTNTSFTNAVIDVLKVTPQTHFTLCDCKGGGTITHTSDIPGQGVTASADFTMYGGKISGNHAGTDARHEDGAGVEVGGTFTMYGGTITDNHVEKRLNYGGGGVVVSGGGEFIMYDGEISHNTSNDDGGGVSVVGASFEMHGGTISGNTATGSGGGVGLWNHSFTLSGGTISNNTAKGDGGGVYFSGMSSSSNTLTISDTVEIRGNSAANGGGVYLKSKNLKMTGGSIINNNATNSGGGVYFNCDTFNVSGNVSITGNKGGATSTGSGLTGGTDNNVYLPDGKIIAVAGALTGSNKIGVTTENTPDNSNYVRIASGNKDNALPDKFRYENDGTIAVSAVVNSSTAKLVACRHNWSGEWKTDPYQHWHVCSICKGKKDVNAHTYDQNVAQEIYKASDANCVSPALYYTSCVCGKKSTETFESGGINPANHRDALGDWRSDENDHWKEYTCCHVHADEGSHHWDEGRETKSPTCTTAGEKTFTCIDCSRTKTETVSATGHNWSSGWTHDDTHHWHECKNGCTEKNGYVEHAGGAANCTKKAVCASCGTDYGDLDPNGHDWGEWSVTKRPTTSAEGEKKRVCKRNDSHTETRAIPKLTPTPSGGGSSSGSSSAPAITVPVSGSGNTVHVSASVSGSTAEVKEIKSAELDKIGTDSAVVIDLSGLNKGVTGVTLSTDTIDSICKTKADGVTIKLPNAELRVDRQTLAAVTEQAAGSKIRLVVEPDSTARNTMTAAQKSTLAGMKNAAALEAYFVSNGTRIHDFKGGSVELIIPYRAEGAIRAWFLKEDGTREPVSARYDKENAQLILHHFSHYVIEELDSSVAYTVCAKDDSCPLGAFGDLTAAAWYHDGVHYCLENGLMRGVSGGTFLPDGSTTRAQLVTILWRLEGSPETTGAAGFGDTAGGAWYTEAVRWAAGCGVVKGYDNGRFGPNDAVTREQMAAILYRYAQHKGYDVSAGNDTNILSFDDAFAVSEYAIPAMQWACGSGMVRGIAQKGGMLLAPRDTTTRAQTATLLMRFQSAFAKAS